MATVPFSLPTGERSRRDSAHYMQSSNDTRTSEVLMNATADRPSPCAVPSKKVRKARSDVVARVLTMEHLEPVVTLDRELFGADAWTWNDFSRAVYGGRGMGFVAWDRKTARVVGYMIFRDLDVRGELLRVGITPAFQRRGLASRMWRLVLSETPAVTCGVWSASASEYYTHAHQWLKKIGFRAVSSRSGEYSFRLER